MVDGASLIDKMSWIFGARVEKPHTNVLLNVIYELDYSLIHKTHRK